MAGSMPRWRYRRRQDVAGVYGLPFDRPPCDVGLADDLADLEAAAGDHRGAGLRPVVAAVAAAQIFGARPNSPHTTTATSLSSPRSCRSVTRAWNPWSSCGSWSLWSMKFFSCVSQSPTLQRHHRHARLDQPAGHQEALAELAVALARRRPAPSSGRTPRAPSARRSSPAPAACTRRCPPCRRRVDLAGSGRRTSSSSSPAVAERGRARRPWPGSGSPAPRPSARTAGGPGRGTSGLRCRRGPAACTSG